MEFFCFNRSHVPLSLEMCAYMRTCTPEATAISLGTDKGSSMGSNPVARYHEKSMFYARLSILDLGR